VTNEDLAKAEGFERLLRVLLTRMLSNGQRRHSLDEVLDHFGVTREELAEE
jgi:DNA-directed RNA polymerase sigma subunit (sigma70/sigma32)